MRLKGLSGNALKVIAIVGHDDRPPGLLARCFQ